MKDARKLVADLLKEVDNTPGEYVRIPKSDAVHMAELLVKARFVSESPKQEDGKIRFFCPTCEKSFIAEGREDQHYFEKWHYHVWYAICPECRREVAQSEGYWR